MTVIQFFNQFILFFILLKISQVDNGKLVANYGQDISLSKVDTSAYVGTWIGTMGDDMSLSVTLNADGTVFAKNYSEEETTGLWTVTN